jgi:hypothetical protein
MKIMFYSADDIAKERFETFLAEKLQYKNHVDSWEFYTYLLELAKSHKHFSGYASASPAYHADIAEAKKQNDTRQEQDNLPEI